LETRVLSILEPVVGKGKVKAKIAANLDFTKVEKTEERFDPDSQVIRSEQRNVEKSTNGMTTGGVPGVSSNLPGKTASQTASTQGQSDKKNETINYEISKVTSHIINPSGEIKRLSVVALVDGVYASQEGSKEKKYSPRSEEELKKFEDMVKNAVGFSADRGDEVRVVNMPFEGSPQEELAEPQREIIPVAITLGRYLVPLLAIVLLLLFVVKPLIKVLTAPSPGGNARVALPHTVAEIERALEIAEKPSGDRLIEWTKKNPKEAANLVKNWIQER
jgi:flagellar M-ring protein FliF